MTGVSTGIPSGVEAPLGSRGALFFTACSYLCVALSFSYLDRRHGFFSGESVFWMVWTFLGFGAALFYLGRGSRVAQAHWTVMGSLAGLFVLIVFFRYNLLRWASVALLLILSARAVVLSTRRDLYLALTVVFVVSLMVATYWTADWTVWFYLAPAWVFAALALAWEHAAGAALSRWVRGGLTLSFVGLAFLLAMLLFLILPRPAVLGFGFLPPGTDTPNLVKQDGGGQGQQPGEGGRPGNAGGSGSAGSDPRAGGGGNGWQQMFQRMQRDLNDPHMPEWQRATMRRLTGWGEVLAAALSGELVVGQRRVPGDELPGSSTLQELGEVVVQVLERVEYVVRIWWPALVLLLLLLWLLYRFWARRYQVAAAILLHGAGGLLRLRPRLSMTLSVLALDCCLRQQGHLPARGVSLREQLSMADSVPDLPRRWLAYALDLYGEVRFGSKEPTVQHAANMHKAVHGASGILAGLLPELRRA